MNLAPDFPAGPPPIEPIRTSEDWSAHLDLLAGTPAVFRALLAGLDDAQLDTRYRRWSIRQIVHHVADSHVNAYARCMLALTEEWPVIRPYDEGAWVTRTGQRPVEAPLALLDGLHRVWASLLGGAFGESADCGYVHPELDQRVPLALVLPQYTWHGSHHAAQIAWLREEHGWT